MTTGERFRCSVLTCFLIVLGADALSAAKDGGPKSTVSGIFGLALVGIASLCLMFLTAKEER